MHNLSSNSCQVIVDHIFLMKYISACSLRQFLTIVKSILKTLIIPEYLTGVYHKGGSNANGRTRHDYVRKVVPERKQCFFFLANVIFLILILTRYRS